MKERRPRTPFENLAVEQMRCVGYPIASWDKRFMRSLSSVETITEKEVPQLWRLFIRYRRQMAFPAKESLLTFAHTLAAPDLRKVEAARKEQAKIDHLLIPRSKDRCRNEQCLMFHEKKFEDKRQMHLFQNEGKL